MEVNQESKRCTNCGEFHPVEFFNWENKSRGKRNNFCKNCTRKNSKKYRIVKGQKNTRKKSTGRPWSEKSNFEKRWGITREEKERLIDLYSEGTRKCGNPACGSTENLVLDHDHTTNEIRGVLCPQCNSGVGFLNDTWESVQGIYEYMRKHYEVDRGYTVTLNKKVHR